MRQFFLLFASTILACACGGPSDAGLFHSDSANSTLCVDGATVACTDTTGCQGQQLCSNGQLGACTCGATSSGGAGGTPLGSGGSSAGGLAGTGGQLGTGGFGGSSGAGASGGDAGVVSSSGGSSDGGQPPSAEAGSDCGAGSYVGTLSGPYSAVIGTSTFTADLTFTVDASGNVSGTLTGTSDKTSSATLYGIMNCVTDAVTISVEKGTYGALPIGGGQYSGSMDGSYDPSSHAFVNGTWKFTEPNSTRGGQGDWTAHADGMLPP